MARQRSVAEGKRRTREHVLADLSVNYTEKQALLCSFRAERVRFDYGIDLIVQTFSSRGEVEASRILFQLKATDRIKVVAGGSPVCCRIERADLAHWLEEPLVVVLVLYDAKADVAYWLYVRRYFAGLVGFDLARCPRRVSVSIPRENILNPKAMRYLARDKNRLRGEAERVAFHVIQ
jgi:hypothetical protein